ncbi:eukaryotic translation initiation factor 3 subunit i [Nicotiana attenuata]|uniref:Eukaryotic translation initiation factor 3 subunit i n=1 Tax=Nicotiana attenuata TaxID=49451 RepID=A0A314KLX3_NICAT|nr:eukaryotic translation initiation factor 3 subunit i [Nicotiana attenuata]
MVTGISADAFDMDSRWQSHKRISGDHYELITNRKINRPSRGIKVECEQLGTSLDIPQLCTVIRASCY